MADLFAKASCTYCQEDINGIRIQCCVCPNFDICLQCFSLGAEIGPHKNDHSYKFVDHYQVNIFGGKGNWTGREELQLLDAIESYGLNWKTISDVIETRTPDEVKDAYHQKYIDGNIGKITWEQARKNHNGSVNDHIPNDKGPLSPEVTSKLPPLEVTPEEAALIGYMPFRDDYNRECEFDVEAEQLVSSLQISPNESNVELALKLAQVDMYVRRLRERSRRKRLVKDYQLVSKFFSQQKKETSKKFLTKEQRELRDKMRVFSQFLTLAEHERLVASIDKERELRHRLSELLRYRDLGLTTQEEIIHYEQHVAYQRQQQLRLNKAGSSGSGISLQEDPTKNGKSEEEQSFIEKKCMSPREDEQNSNYYCNNNYSSSNETNNSLKPDNILNQTPLNGLPLDSLLCENEIQLCTTLNLEPIQYITLKSVIIQENLSGIKPKLPDPETNPIVSVKDVVTQYLHTSGWLPDL